MSLRVVWKCAVVECGAQSVMIFGTLLMLMLCVDSLAIPARVGYQRIKSYTGALMRCM